MHHLEILLGRTFLVKTRSSRAPSD
jgi:hypothetical protein